jgi:hypothetical protein
MLRALLVSILCNSKKKHGSAQLGESETELLKP